MDSRIDGRFLNVDALASVIGDKMPNMGVAVLHIDKWGHETVSDVAAVGMSTDEQGFQHLLLYTMEGRDGDE